MLTFDNITKVFKSDLFAQNFVALKNVSFEIPSHSMVGFLGANGAGKTTSLKIIMDFIRADQGEIKFSNDLGNNRSEIFKRIGFLPERPYFYPNLTGEEFLHFMGHLSEMSTNDLKSSIMLWAPRFKMDHALKRPLRTYSKGMLQRIGFMATILHSPDFIILDEPLSGLDPIGRKELKDVIVEVHKAGKTVFFSSHIVSDIEEICDRVIFLKQGELVYDGKVVDLISSGTSSSYEIKYRSPYECKIKVKHTDFTSLADNLYTLKVNEDLKKDLLDELIQNQFDIVGVELIKPSLEQIFYNIKNKS